MALYQRSAEVCRRLPLPRNGRKRVEEPSLDASFLDGIKEDLCRTCLVSVRGEL